MNSKKIIVPPIKIQGIKTKIVNMIREYADVNSNTIWIEPFMGSGVVGFNIAPKNAIFADTNPHIIEFYRQIQSGEISSNIVRLFLEKEGKKLSEKDELYYYEVRDRFNKNHNPLDFLFLNRSCFNGMIRFNRKYEFNVPYGHKPNRFSKAYVTKIVNQVAYVEMLVHENNWKFLCQPFYKTIEMACENSFIYCDPPYIGRHVDYYDSWDDVSEYKLHDCLKQSNAKFILSTWDHNKYRQNSYLNSVWGDYFKLTKEHFYHIGGKEINRNSMIEALIMNYQPMELKYIKEDKFGNTQMSFFEI